MLRRHPDRVRVILETNLWSYLAVSGAVAEFDAEAASRGLQIVTPPSVLLEVLNTRNSSRRLAIVDAMRRGRRMRPQSEAESECNEVVAEVRRLHPGWLRQISDTATAATLRTFWTRGIWREAESRARLGPRVSLPEDRIKSLIARNQRMNASKAKSERFDLRNLNCLKATTMPDDATEGSGWRDEQPVDLWRAETAVLYWRQLMVVGSRAVLTGEDSTFADWVGAYVDLRALRQRKDEFFAMWLYEVQPQLVLRNWVSWAIVWAQMQRRIDASGPIDAQHSAYLCDGDVFLTADRRFAHALNVVASQAPAPVAKTQLVTGVNDRVVDAIFEALDRA